MKHLVAATVCLCIVGAGPAEAEWAFAGLLGAGHTLTGALSVVQPAVDTDVTFASVEYHGESFTPPLYYGYRVTYFLPRVPWLGVEAEFIHLKAYARTDAVTRTTGHYLGDAVDRDAPVNEILESFSLSHGLNFALGNIVARRVLAGRAGTRGRVELVGRAGVGPTIPHAESRIGGVVHEGYEMGAPGVQAAGGIEIGLVHGLAAIAEYKLTTTNQHVSIPQGEAHGRFTSHHAVFGLSWHR